MGNPEGVLEPDRRIDLEQYRQAAGPHRFCEGNLVWVHQVYGVAGFVSH